LFCNFRGSIPVHTRTRTQSREKQRNSFIEQSKTQLSVAKFKLFSRVSIVFVLWILQSHINDTQIINSFGFVFKIYFWKKYVYSIPVHTWMCLWKQKIPISFKVNDNLRCQVLTGENRGGHWATPLMFD
jgi:hypothetical protein